MFQMNAGKDDGKHKKNPAPTLRASGYVFVRLAFFSQTRRETSSQGRTPEIMLQLRPFLQSQRGHHEDMCTEEDTCGRQVLPPSFISPPPEQLTLIQCFLVPGIVPSMRKTQFLPLGKRMELWKYTNNLLKKQVLNIIMQNLPLITLFLVGKIHSVLISLVKLARRH